MTLLSGVMLGADLGPQEDGSIIVRAHFTNLDRHVSTQWIGHKLVLKVAPRLGDEKPTGVLALTIVALRPADIAGQAFINHDNSRDAFGTATDVCQVGLSEAAEDGTTRFVDGSSMMEAGTESRDNLEWRAFNDLYENLTRAATRLIRVERAFKLVEGDTVLLNEDLFARDQPQPIWMRVRKEDRPKLAVWLDQALERGLLRP